MIFSRATALPPHLRRGAEVERSALAFLRRRGLELVARNYRCAAGELDLVMREQRELVFVEVRYRNSDRFGGAARSVDAAKQRKLRHAGDDFLQRHPKLAYTACRFDVIAVEGDASDADGYRIDWIRDAF